MTIKIKEVRCWSGKHAPKLFYVVVNNKIVDTYLSRHRAKRKATLLEQVQENK